MVAVLAASAAAGDEDCHCADLIDDFLAELTLEASDERTVF